MSTSVTALGAQAVPARVQASAARAHGRHSTRQVDAVLLTVCVTSMIVVMADTIAATLATPALAAHPLPGMSSQLTHIQWLSAVYAAPVAGLLTVTGRAADLVGRRRLLAIGLLVFALGSVAVLVAPAWWALLAARAGQGAGIAAIIPASLGLLLADVVPARRAMAVAAWSAASGVGTIAGYACGGWLTEEYGWRAMFVPTTVTALTLLVATSTLPAPRLAGRRRLPDLLGALLVTAGLGLLVLALSQGATWGWRSAEMGVCAGGGLVLLALAALRSRTHPVPVLELSLWRRAGFGWGWVLGGLYGLTAFPVLFTAPIFLQEAGFAPRQISMLLLPLAVAMALASYLAGRLCRSWQPGTVVTWGSLLAGAGCVELLRAPDPALSSLAAMVALGLGLGMLSTGASIIGTLAATPAQYAAASGACMTARMAGGALGVAGAATLLSHPLLPGPGPGYASVLAGCLLVAALAAAGTLIWAVARPAIDLLESAPAPVAPPPERDTWLPRVPPRRSPVLPQEPAAWPMGQWRPIPHGAIAVQDSLSPRHVPDLQLRPSRPLSLEPVTEPLTAVTDTSLWPRRP